MTSHARAILWAQFRSWVNYYPRSSRTGAALSLIFVLLWYGMWATLGVVIFRAFSEPDAVRFARLALPRGLLLAFLYWQIVPVLLAATGVSLELKKLQIYPIPEAQLFFIELLLRVTTGIEVLILLAGLAAGLFANPELPKWAGVGLAPFIVINLCVSAGTREILVRLMARKRLREVMVLLLVSVGAIPQLLIYTGAWKPIRDWFTKSGAGWWPWSAAAQIVYGESPVMSMAALMAWTAAAFWFGRRQFHKSLSFDAAEGNATRARTGTLRTGLWDRLCRWPSAVFRDPLAAIVEKEIRFLARAPRFRLVFTMGFTFGLVIWLPLAFRHAESPGFTTRNYLTLVSGYAVLLLGDVCFWNIFGFDRSAAQAFWAMPVRFETVLAAKNIAALFFVLLEVTLILLVCGALRMPVDASRVLEAYAIAVVVSLYLASLGNMTSTSAPRALNPAKSMRSGSPGRMQVIVFLIYPVAFAPAVLAFGARYAFRGEWAFFAALAVSAGVGVAMYWVAMESAVARAFRDRERIITALSEGEGIIQA